MFTKPEANNCFSINTQVIAWKTFKKINSNNIFTVLQAACETNVKIVFSDKTTKKNELDGYFYR